MRPIERLWQLGLLTPGPLNAVHMTPRPRAAGYRCGAALRLGASALSSEASLKSEHQLPPARLIRRVPESAMGLGHPAAPAARTVWGEMQLLALMTRASRKPLRRAGLQAPGMRSPTGHFAGGAAVLGLDGGRGARLEVRKVG